MDPRERELRQKLSGLLDEARAALEGGKMDEARAAKDKAEVAKNELDLYIQLRDMAPKPETTKPITVTETEARGEEDHEKEYRTAFMKALKGQTLSAEERQIIDERRAMVAGVAEDGGLVIPQDITTDIKELMRAEFSLVDYVNVEPVGTLSGSRVIEKEAEMTGFVDITEMTNIDEMTNPKMVNVTYAVKDRGGILPISNTLLKDTDQNILGYVRRWIAKKSRVTKNKLIVNLLNTISTKTDLATLDDMKKLANKGLDQALVPGAKWYTNSDGFHHLDTLKDLDGKYYLQPDPTQPSRKLLSGKEVVVVPTSILPTTGTTTKKAPLIFGNLKEAITLFDRETYELKATDVGGDAFKRNSTDLRVIEREDIKFIDTSAVKYGQIDVTSTI